jgi:hypothetical protein
MKSLFNTAQKIASELGISVDAIDVTTEGQVFMIVKNNWKLVGSMVNGKFVIA